MFGYIRVCKEELDEENFRRFGAYYCGLCKEMGKYSNIVRLGLSYDMTFLCILLSAVCDTEEEIKRCRCMLHPTKKKDILQHNKILKYTADMSILLAYRKLEDDKRDEHSLKALGGMLIYRSAMKKVKNQYPDIDDKISLYLTSLSKLEKENCAESDRVADCFAKICEILFVPDFIEDENTKKTLAWIGYNIGRWIYLADAIDDLGKDIKNKEYNPFVHKSDKVYKEAEVTLTYTLASIAAAYDLLEIRRNDIILKNILYTGLYGMQTKILNKWEEKDESV